MSWLSKPYPLIVKTKPKLWLVVGFGLFTYLFLLIYQPFGATDIEVNREVFLMGFGLSVIISLSITYFILPKLLSNLFNPELWTIGKEILFLCSSFFLVSFTNYLYNSIVGDLIAPQHSLLVFLGITFSVGIFPLIILVFLVEIFLNRSNVEKAANLTESIETTSINDPVSITIVAETKKSDPFVVKENDFLFAVSDNNYSTIFFLDQDKVSRQLLRLKFKHLEEQLATSKALIRCHRSYIVNKRKIKKFEGNARSLMLVLDGYEERIPVSRGVARDQLL